MHLKLETEMGGFTDYCCCCCWQYVCVWGDAQGERQLSLHLLGNTRLATRARGDAHTCLAIARAACEGDDKKNEKWKSKKDPEKSPCASPLTCAARMIGMHPWIRVSLYIYTYGGGSSGYERLCNRIWAAMRRGMGRQLIEEKIRKKFFFVLLYIDTVGRELVYLRL